ncbi:MAG: hypothetical protein JOZ73_00500 [Solirubrobacterales bacterium]|nr:hypothetical protein [Solirubrobacterales bacterium]
MAATTQRNRSTQSRRSTSANGRRSSKQQPRRNASARTSKSQSNGNAPSKTQGNRKTPRAKKNTSNAPKKKPVRKAVKSAAKSAPTAIAKTATKKPARKVAAWTIGKAVKNALGSAAELVREGVDRARTRGLDAIRDAADRAAEAAPEVEELKRPTRRLPIQRSIDVAVPIHVVWGEWMELQSIPEGVHTISDIAREGNELFGHIDGPRQGDWEAEILDQRERQSFAWQSHAGTDCAGLVTFHRLSERLTRIELNLDVVPTTPAEAVQLATHIADHRAATELRRFKARLELINPDLYEGEEPEPADDDEPEPYQEPHDDEEPLDDEELDEQDREQQAEEESTESA